MLAATDVKGVMAMMPAFTTPDGGSIHAKNTIATDNLAAGVDRIIRDGIGVLTTTGSFGECHTLLLHEYQTIFDATVQAARQRVPVFLGCTSLNTRETLLKMEMAQKAGGDGVLVGVPYYFGASVDNAVQFYFDIADEFPDLAIMIYHNPRNHNITIPVDAFRRLIEKPNIIAMKDSHREPMALMRLQEITGGRVSVFTNQMQLYPYMMLGTAGCWSIHAWLGPSPVVRAYRAAAAGDWVTAKQICMDMNSATGGREGMGGGAGAEGVSTALLKLAMNEAGYCHPGPARPPFRVLPAGAQDQAKDIARKWQALCDKYPLEAPVGAAAR